MTRTRLMRWLVVAAWAALIWLLSGIPHLTSGLPQDLILRKLAHAAEFAILAILVWRAMPANANSKEHNFGRRLALTILISLIYALIDEEHQRFVAGRVGSVADIVIDLSGILTGAAWVSARLDRFLRHRRS